MNTRFKPTETFRRDFDYCNSNEAILRFPFPFAEDAYMYSVNIEPHVRGGPTAALDSAFDVDEHYVAECRERAIVLDEDPGRCKVLPHMMMAQWDTLELIMESFAEDYPEDFSLTKSGTRWTWENRPLGLKQTFTFGDAATLPCEPFEYITRQAQGDFTLQDQREDNLFVDGGMVTTQADWSLEFNIGMTFHEWHGPVPARASNRRFRPRIEIFASASVWAASAQIELDDDYQSEARHEPRELSPLGTRPDDRHP